MDVPGQGFPPTSERGDSAESLQAGLPRRGTAADHSPHSSPLPCHASVGSGSRHPNDPSLAGPSSHRDHGSVHARHLGGFVGGLGGRPPRLTRRSVFDKKRTDTNNPTRTSIPAI